MSLSFKEIFRIFALAALAAPIFVSALTITLHPQKRSATYSMGIIPYYVYGPSVDVNTAIAVKALPIKTFPKMPMAGGGGRNANAPFIKAF